MKAKDLILILQEDPEAEVLIHDYSMEDFDDSGTNTYSECVKFCLPNENRENVVWDKPQEGGYLVLSGDEQVLFSWEKEYDEGETCEDCGVHLQDCTCDYSELEEPLDTPAPLV